jgi:hypothetical protein
MKEWNEYNVSNSFFFILSPGSDLTLYFKCVICSLEGGFGVFWFLSSYVPELFVFSRSLQ